MTLIPIAFRLSPGQDLLESLSIMVQSKQMQAACILTCLGSLTEASIRFADSSEPTLLPGPFEIVSMSGTLSTLGSHVHLAISDQQGMTYGGHLMPGCLVYTTAEIVLGILPDTQFLRSFDPHSGYDELEILSED